MQESSTSSTSASQASQASRASRASNCYSHTEGVALKEYFESRLIAIEKASELAVKTLDKRLEGMNEFREALKDTTSRLATREELNLKTSLLSKDITDLQLFRSSLEGKASQQSLNVTMALTLLSLVISLASLLMR